MELIKCDICGKDIDLDDPNTTILTDLVNKIIFCPICKTEIYIPLYLCDPNKNKKCSKTSCQTYCFSTFRKQFAKKPLKIMKPKDEYNKVEENIHKLEE